MKAQVPLTPAILSLLAEPLSIFRANLLKSFNEFLGTNVLLSRRFDQRFNYGCKIRTGYRIGNMVDFFQWPLKVRQQKKISSAYIEMSGPPAWTVGVLDGTTLALKYERVAQPPAVNTQAEPLL